MMVSLPWSQSRLPRIQALRRKDWFSSHDDLLERFGMVVAFWRRSGYQKKFFGSLLECYGFGMIDVLTRRRKSNSQQLRLCEQKRRCHKWSELVEKRRWVGNLVRNSWMRRRRYLWVHQWQVPLSTILHSDCDGDTCFGVLSGDIVLQSFESRFFAITSVLSDKCPSLSILQASRSSKLLAVKT